MEKTDLRCNDIEKREPLGAAHHELEEPDITWSRWEFLVCEGNHINSRHVCPSDFKKHMIRYIKEPHQKAYGDGQTLGGQWSHHLGKFDSFAWSKDDKRQMCRKQDTEVHRLYESQGWKDVESWTMRSGRTEELR